MPKEYVINHFSRNSNTEFIKIVDLLNDPNTPPDVYVNSFCFLGYRLLEGKFTDSEFIFDKIKLVLKRVEDIEDETAKYRWKSSVLMICIYLKINEKFDVDDITPLIESACNLQFVIKWPRIIVNVLIANILKIALAILKNDFVKANQTINYTFDVYKTAITNMQLNSHVSDSITGEIIESSKLITVCIFMGKLTDFKIQYDSIPWKVSEFVYKKMVPDDNLKYAYSSLCKILPQLKY